MAIDMPYLGYLIFLQFLLSLSLKYFCLGVNNVKNNVHILML